MSAVSQTSLLGAASGGGGSGPPATSYANTGGTGNRATIITVSSTFSAGGGSPSSLADGTTGAGTYWVNAAQSSGNWTFDFGAGAAKYIDEIKWYQDIAASQGTYTFEGSNDNSSFTAIQTGVALGGSATTTVSLTPLTSSLWRYFRLRMTGGATSGSPFVREIEFRISA